MVIKQIITYWKAGVIGRLVAVALISLFSFSLSSCFTGIESTKKIHLSREDRKKANPSPEEIFMDQIEAFPLQSWERGKKFIVSDDKALIVLVPQKGLFPTGPDSIKGRTIEYTGIESKINAAGNLTVTILFSDGIYIYAFDTGKEFKNAMEGFYSDQIPMVIDLDMIKRAKELLTGKQLWTRSNLWYDKDGNRIDGKKFVEVTVEDILPGNMVFPLQVKVKTPDDDTAYLFINFGNADNESRSFHNIFSLSDIKKNYPGIDLDTWQYICEGRVKPGMTKDECRLALGNPTDLNSGHDYSQTLDIWSYENGRILWFEDGRLTRIRQ